MLIFEPNTNLRAAGIRAVSISCTAIQRRAVHGGGRRIDHSPAPVICAKAGRPLRDHALTGIAVGIGCGSSIIGGSAAVSFGFIAKEFKVHRIDREWAAWGWIVTLVMI